jgi:NAD(P)-dependent dehydrogenase (short-subunit alcohol dehydrogenase family)
VALVTGASRGIGKASALALARHGFDVAVGARTLHEGDGRDDSDRGHQRAIGGSLETTAAEVEALGGRALALRMDLLDRASLVTAVDRVVDDWGHLDVLVNNAVHTGPGSMDHVVDLDIATVETKLEANVIAQLILIKHALPAMLARGRGRIINITSAVASTDPPAPAGQGGWGLGYALTKGAFHRIAGILAVELGPRGILAFNVEPGFVLTERMESNQGELGFEGRYRGAPPSVPAAVVAWLAGGDGSASSEEARALNGTTIAAQKFALDRGLHPDWRAPRAANQG